MKKALRETQTLRVGCSKAEPKKFAPSQTPLPGAQVQTTQFGEDRCTQFRVIVVTDPQRNKATKDRTDYNRLRR